MLVVSVTDINHGSVDHYNLTSTRTKTKMLFIFTLQDVRRCFIDVVGKSDENFCHYILQSPFEVKKKKLFLLNFKFFETKKYPFDDDLVFCALINFLKNIVSILKFVFVVCLTQMAVDVEFEPGEHLLHHQRLSPQLQRNFQIRFGLLRNSRTVHQ